LTSIRKELEMEAVRYEADGPVVVVTIDRQAVRNAVDPPTAGALVEAFERFDADPSVSVAVLTGAGGTFCAGFDLKSLAGGGPFLAEMGPSPMGPARMQLGKSVVAAVEGYAVGGGFELALWCDLRVSARDAVFGVFNRRFGVPLVDLGTVRLPRLIGHSRAMDLILTGRGVSGEEAFDMGLANRLVEPGVALDAAVELARDLARFPQVCLRSDRLSAIEQWGMAFDDAMRNEYRHGMEALSGGEFALGAERFAAGAGRHGER
jgi:enoyl-CoA hydratase